MQILAIDSSALVASVAIVEDDGKAGAKTLAEYTVNHRKTHSQTLLPMLDEIVKMTEFSLEGLDAIAVAGGPGSFTGLRIGSATAKGLGLALGKPLIHIPTLEALAYNLWGTDGIVCPIMDARRNQVYTGIYEFVDGKLGTLMRQTAMGIEELAEKLCVYDREINFLGDGVLVHRENLEKSLMAGKRIRFAPAHMAYQRAASVGALALEYFREGRTETAAEHKPDYLRPSQAERERAQREKAAKESAGEVS
ncbi:MAG: tRNA (adenosine(37)-N6)-threonylcarbamoyltransferase complex dimerization subunit type 1 TsaB [Coprococcus sp.]|nr:tRNA (adenosine(37)-N6)-threonylcarbamoyltransferase complex dimerization subunit type 1 TsaB [Coprococcus sp.]